MVQQLDLGWATVARSSSTAEEVDVYFPLTVADFIDRAVATYPDRVAVIDEPGQPAASWAEVT